MSEPDAITTFRDIVVALSAATTAVAAVIGLRSWRRQQEWAQDREVARELARACIRAHDAFRSARSRMIWSSEFPADWDATDPDPAAKSRAHAYAYGARFDRLQDQMNRLEAAALEAEVLWGSDVASAMQRVRVCRSRLFTSIDLYVEELATGEVDRRDPAMLRTIHDVHDQGDDDEFTSEIHSSIDALLDFARPHLERRGWFA